LSSLLAEKAMALKKTEYLSHLPKPLPHWECGKNSDRLVKKTTKLTLVFIASISIAATSCSFQDSRYGERCRQEVYPSLVDCQRDWGLDRCEQVTDSSYPPGHYYGPCYYRERGTTYYYHRHRRLYITLPTNTNFYKRGRSSNSVGNVNRNNPNTGRSTSGSTVKGGNSGKSGGSVNRGGSGSTGKSTSGGRASGRGGS